LSSRRSLAKEAKGGDRSQPEVKNTPIHVTKRTDRTIRTKEFTMKRGGGEIISRERERLWHSESRRGKKNLKKDADLTVGRHLVC